MLKLTVTEAGGDPFEVVVPGRVLLDWEAEHQEPLQKAINSGMSECAYRVTYASLKARYGESRSYDDWLDRVDDVVMQPVDVEFYFRSITQQTPPSMIRYYAGVLTKIADAREGGHVEDEVEPVEDDLSVPTGGDPDPSVAGSPT